MVVARLCPCFFLRFSVGTDVFELVISSIRNLHVWDKEGLCIAALAEVDMTTISSFIASYKREILVTDNPTKILTGLAVHDRRRVVLKVWFRHVAVDWVRELDGL